MPWRRDQSGHLCHRRQVNGGRGEITLCLTDSSGPEQSLGLEVTEAEAVIANSDVRAACLHLLFAAYATSLDQPWEQTFTVSDQEISAYLGLDKRKDLNKLAKLTLIKNLVEQPCKLLVTVDWSHQDRFRHIRIPQSYLWHLLDTQHHFQADHQGSQHLTGMTFTIKPGAWAQFFLNRQNSRAGTAFFQYGTLPKSLVTNVMSIWQQYEGAARMMLWLLFKTRMGTERKSLQLSQRDLARHVGKSQSWVRDIESGRLQAGCKDQQILLKVLGVGRPAG